MKTHKRSLLSSLTTTGIMLVLATCTAAAHAVGIETLNYTARDLNYIAVEAPDDPSNSGGGDGATPRLAAAATSAVSTFPTNGVQACKLLYCISWSRKGRNIGGSWSMCRHMPAARPAISG